MRSASTFRIALVQCRMQDILKDHRFQSDNIGIGILGAVLRQRGYSVDIIDAHLRLWSVRRLIEHLDDGDFDMIGISCSAQEAAMHTFYVIDELRSRGNDAHICLGGHYATFAWDEILLNASGVDSIVLSEGEQTIVDLVSAVSVGTPIAGMPGVACRSRAGLLAGPSRDLIDDLDTIPFAERDDLDLLIRDNRRVSITASRGCYANCSFCTIPSFYGNRIRRRRSPENIVAELSDLHERGAHKFRFNDDIFIDRSRAGRAWVLEVCERILDAGMHDLNFWVQGRASDFTPEVVQPLLQAGLHKVFIGVESASQSQLDRYNKQLESSDNVRAIELLGEYGVPEVEVGFIMFDPESTIEDIEINLEFLRAIDQYNAGNLLSRMMVYKGAPMYPEMLAKGELILDDWMSVPDYNFTDARVRTLVEVSRDLWDIADPFVMHEFRIDIVDRKLKQLVRQLRGDGREDPVMASCSAELTPLNIKYRRALAEALVRPFEVAIMIAKGETTVDRDSYAAWSANSVRSDIGDLLQQTDSMLDEVADRWGIEFSFHDEDASREVISTWARGWRPWYEPNVFDEREPQPVLLGIPRRGRGVAQPTA